MEKQEIKIIWDGPYNLEDVIERMNDEGEDPDYEGPDYGLYQIYGTHILCGPDTLLYVGEALDQSFSKRFNQHKNEWLGKEENAQIYLGRIYDSTRHSRIDNWDSWKKDVDTAESVIIYKYSPHYNSQKIRDFPKVNVRLIHAGLKHNLHEEDNAPEDLEYRDPSIE